MPLAMGCRPQAALECAPVQAVRSVGGNDTVSGGGGLDELLGGKGDDLYFVDQQGEAREKNNEGVDTVRSSVSYTLAKGLENLVLTGQGASDGKGNAEDNHITGNASDNDLFGKDGNDALTDGLGEDRFVFDTALSVNNVDKIVGYSTADDSFRLDDAVFSSLNKGVLAASFFRIAPAAADADDHIIYNRATGDLFYDADGNGGDGQIRFAAT